jgi:hypothetical protein
MKYHRLLPPHFWVDVHVCKNFGLPRIPFLGLPKLLLSATILVELGLWEIPHSGYISPEAMVAGLSVLTSLERLLIEFESPQSRPDPRGRRPPPPTRTLLPVLTVVCFKGVSEYLEDLVAWIDAPLLEYLHITFFQQLIFDTPQLNQFISRTPKFKTQDEADVVFSEPGVSVTLPQTFEFRRRAQDSNLVRTVIFAGSVSGSGLQ